MEQKEQMSMNTPSGCAAYIFLGWGHKTCMYCTQKCNHAVSSPYLTGAHVSG